MQSADPLTPRDRRALLAILLAVALGSLDTAIANTALPAIAGDLRASPSASIWVINAYQMAIVATLLPFAALGDLWGPRKVFLGGLAFFTLSSLACALADSLVTLTLARTLQGIGAGAIMAVNIALIRLIYPAHRLGRGVGLNALMVGLAFAVGPTVASLVLSLGRWPWLFAINVPLGLLCFGFGLTSLPRSEPRSLGFDPATAVLTALTFAALILALGAATQREDLHWQLLALATTGVAAALLLRRQAGHPAPMLPVDLLRRPLFALSALTAVCAFATQGLALVSLPFYFEQVLHRDPVETGFLMTPWAVVVAAMAPLAGRLSDRHAPGLLGGIGLAVLALGMVALALLPAQPGRAGHQPAHGAVRHRLRLFPVAEPARADVQRPARARRRRQRRDRDVPAPGASQRRGAGGAVLRPGRRHPGCHLGLVAGCGNGHAGGAGQHGAAVGALSACPALPTQTPNANGNRNAAASVRHRCRAHAAPGSAWRLSWTADISLPSRPPVAAPSSRAVWPAAPPARPGGPPRQRRRTSISCSCPTRTGATKARPTPTPR